MRRCCKPWETEGFAAGFLHYAHLVPTTELAMIGKVTVFENCSKPLGNKAKSPARRDGVGGCLGFATRCGWLEPSCVWSRTCCRRDAKMRENLITPMRLTLRLLGSGAAPPRGTAARRAAPMRTSPYGIGAVRRGRRTVPHCAAQCRTGAAPCRTGTL